MEFAASKSWREKKNREIGNVKNEFLAFDRKFLQSSKTPPTILNPALKN